MNGRFHVRYACFRGIDVDPEYWEVPMAHEMEFYVNGYVVNGDLKPGMFINFRPPSRRAKYYRIQAIEKIDPKPEMAKAMEQTLRQNGLDVTGQIREQIEELRMVTYNLTITVTDHTDLKELYDLEIRDEDADLFEDIND